MTNEPNAMPGGTGTVVLVFRWVYIVLTCILVLAFGGMIAAAQYLYNSHTAGLLAALFVLCALVGFVLRDGFGISLMPWIEAEPVRARELPWRYVGLVAGYGFAAWCVYMGVYVPARYEAEFRQMESSLRTLTEDSVGENNIGESLDD
jgi:hypothetical protein